MIRELLTAFPREGRLQWIGLSPGRKQPIVEVMAVDVEWGTGLVGDRHASSGRGMRQVTVLQGEHLPVVSALVGREVSPDELRRNLVVSGINVWALRDQVFRIGAVVLHGTGPCAPCSRMEANLGWGGYNAVRGHGGITARVVEAGRIEIGDSVAWVQKVGDDA